MKNINRILSVLLVAIVMVACKNGNKNSTETAENKEDNTQKTEQRIISLNGAITATIAELGHGDELVGRDVTSTYPNWVKDSVKDLGHVRSLSMEALMALKPTLILASEADMNPDLKEKIKDSKITFKLFARDFSVDASKELIKQVAEFIGATEDKVQPLLNKIDQDLAKIKEFEKKPKVLFIYARGAGTMMVAGNGTSMGSMIQIAGGENAAKALNNFKPLTTEALLNIDPDVILLFESGLKSLNETGGLSKIPGVLETKAGKNKAIITMEGGLLSNFGPRVGEAALRLNQLLVPYAK